MYRNMKIYMDMEMHVDVNVDMDVVVDMVMNMNTGMDRDMDIMYKFMFYEYMYMNSNMYMRLIASSLQNLHFHQMNHFIATVRISQCLISWSLLSFRSIKIFLDPSLQS